jgi:hypothetical protein
MKSSRPQGTTNGSQKLFSALRRFQPHLTGKIPAPGSPWEAWAAYRIDRLESQQSWMTRLIIGALVLQVGLQVLGML